MSWPKSLSYRNKIEHTHSINTQKNRVNSEREGEAAIPSMDVALQVGIYLKNRQTINLHRVVQPGLYYRTLF
jgi:hypothetical protein